MSRLIALAGLALYACQSRVDHDGKTYLPGQPIKLDTDAAQDLLDLDAIGHADQSGASALQAAITDGQAQRLRVLEDALDRSEEDRERLRLELQDANAKATELKSLADCSEIALSESQAAHATALADLARDAAKLRDTNADLQAQLDAAKADVAKATETVNASTKAAKGK